MNHICISIVLIKLFVVVCLTTSFSSSWHFAIHMRVEAISQQRKLRQRFYNVVSIGLGCSVMSILTVMHVIDVNDYEL